MTESLHSHFLFWRYFLPLCVGFLLMAAVVKYLLSQKKTQKQEKHHDAVANDVLSIIFSSSRIHYPTLCRHGTKSLQTQLINLYITT